MAAVIGHGLTAAQSVTSTEGNECERGQRWLTWNKVQFLSTGLAIPPPPRSDQRNVTFCIDGVVVEADVLSLRDTGGARRFVLSGDVTLTMSSR